MRRGWFMLLVLAAGCDGPVLAPVSGRVTLDGEPLVNAVVLAQPIGDRHNPGSGSTGRTDADGRYTLRHIQSNRAGAIIGKHRISITTAPAGIGGEDAAVPDRLPAIYNSKTTLELTVPPDGRSDADFALFSRAK